MSEKDWADRIADSVVNHHCYRDNQPGDVPVWEDLANDIAAALRAERALYEVAWRECYRHRWPEDPQAGEHTPEQKRCIAAHDAARKEMGL